MSIVQRERQFSDAINRYEGDLTVRNHKAYDKDGNLVIELDRRLPEDSPSPEMRGIARGFNSLCDYFDGLFHKK